MDTSLEAIELSRISAYVTAASWLVNVWEWFIRLDDEVTFIWPMAHTAYIKWLYLFGKYFGLLVQSGVFAVQVVYFQHNSMSLKECRVYRTIEMVAVTLLMLCFDIVLLLRIYAFYGRQVWSCAFATCAALIELVTTMVTILAAIPATTYDSSCMMMQISKILVVFVVGTFTTQAVLVWLAYRKRQRVVRPRTSIAWVTIRDGVLVFVCVIVFLAIVFACILQNSPMTSVMIVFLPMFISVGTCHLILNVQRVSQAQSMQQFTTEIWGLDRDADSFLLSNALFQSRPSR